MLSCLLHMVHSLFYVAHSLLLSLLSNCTSSPKHSPSVSAKGMDVMGGFHSTPLSLALPDGITANPGVKEEACIAIDFNVYLLSSTLYQ